MTEARVIFEGAFSADGQYPTKYDEFGDPKTLTREERVKIAAKIFEAYHEAIRDGSLTPEDKEIADIELDGFTRWVELDDGEHEEAQQLAREAELEKILGPHSTASPEVYAAALREKAKFVAQREIKQPEREE